MTQYLWLWNKTPLNPYVLYSTVEFWLTQVFTTEIRTFVLWDLLLPIITYYYISHNFGYMYKKSSKFSESSGPVVGSSILYRKIPLLNFTYYYQYLQLYVYIYQPIKICGMCYGSVVGLQMPADCICWPLRQQSRLLWNSPAVLWSSLQGNSPVGRNIPRQLCALAHV